MHVWRDAIRAISGVASSEQARIAKKRSRMMLEAHRRTKKQLIEAEQTELVAQMEKLEDALNGYIFWRFAKL